MSGARGGWDARIVLPFPAAGRLRVGGLRFATAASRFKQSSIKELSEISGDSICFRLPPKQLRRHAPGFRALLRLATGDCAPWVADRCRRWSAHGSVVSRFWRNREGANDCELIRLWVFIAPAKLIHEFARFTHKLSHPHNFFLLRQTACGYRGWK